MDRLTCPFCDSPDVARIGQWGGQIITAQWVCRACNSHFEAIREDFDDPPGAEPASIAIRRRIEWMDTDAAGIYHWTTAFRLAEAAEAALHTALGFAGRTFGATPRVAVNAEFRQPLRFNDVVEAQLRVETVGRTSVEYALDLRGPNGVAATGSIITCLIDRETRRAVPWPDDIAALLRTAGPQTHIE
jgi:acyl-CoA thioesterase FadM